jgi:putative transposase
MQALIDGDKELSEVPSSQRRPMPKTLACYSNTTDSRNDAIVIAYAGGGYTLKEIGAYFGIHYTTVSGVIKNHKSRPDPAGHRCRSHARFLLREFR